MRKIVVFSAAGAVVLVAAAAVLRFAVLPGLAQVPDNLDTTLRYTGTADLVDTAALQSGDLAAAMKTGVPVTVEERVRAASTHGSAIVLTDEITAAAGGTPLLKSSHTYAVDRKTLEAVPPPSGTKAEAAQGLVLGFPLAPEAKDYQYWDSATQTAVPADYQRTEQHAGTETYVYTVQASGPLKDPSMQSTVPPALPKATLLALATTLPADVQTGLKAQAAALPEQIPLAYTATNNATFWVDTGTGVVVDVNQKQTVAAALSLGPATVPLANVFSLDVKFAPETVTAVGDEADSARSGLTLIGVVLPLVLLGLALILLLLALWGLRRGRAAQPAAGSPAPAEVDARARD